MFQLLQALANHRIYVRKQNEITDHRPLFNRNHFTTSITLLPLELLNMLSHDHFCFPALIPVELAHL
ncbi:hypothetical protein D3C81_2286430 [compost metagenome]